MTSSKESDRVWIFALENEVSPDSVPVLERSLLEFVQTWKAHGKPVHGSAAVLHNRFLVLTADGERCEVSGCSIDVMFRAVSDAARGVGAAVAPVDRIFYRSPEGIRCVTRDEFKKLAQSGEITLETTVFNNTVQSAPELQAAWEIPAGSSWHSRLIASV